MNFRQQAMLAGLVLLALPSARADSSVTVYGIVDGGLTYANNQLGSRYIHTHSGKLSGSRLGFRGMEDLGGGLKAVFVIEQGFNLVNGSLQQGSRAWGRQAYVGLQSDQYGRLTLGRQYSPFELYVGFLSAGLRFGTSLVTDPFDLNMLGGSVRFNNSLVYESPRIAGFTYSMQYALSEQAKTTAGTGFKNNREYGAAIKYESKDLRLGLGYGRLDGPNSATNQGGATVGDYPGAFPSWFKQYDARSSGTASTAALALGSEQVIAAGGVYQMDKIGLGFMASRTLVGSLGISGARSAGFNTSQGSFAMNAGEVSLTYNTTPLNMVGTMVKYTGAALQTGASRVDLGWWTFAIANDYNFSKRTDLYVSLAYEVATGRNNIAQLTLDGPSSTRHQTAAAIGLRHRF